MGVSAHPSDTGETRDMADQADLLTQDLPIESGDPDDAILAELEAIEKANAAAEKAAEGEDTTGGAAAPAGDDTATGAAAEPEPAPAPQPEPTIPKARFDAVNNRARELEIENARLRGLAEGRKEAADRVAAVPAEPAVPKVDPAAVRLTEIDGEGGALDKLYAKYDGGDMTLGDLRKEERKLQMEAQQIRDGQAEQRRLAAERKAPAAEPTGGSVNGDIRLTEMTEKLAAGQCLARPRPAEIVAEQYVPLAERLLRQRGYALTKDPAGAWRLRYATVEVAKAMGAYRLFSPKETWPAEEGEAAPVAEAAPAQAAPETENPTAALTPAQVREKLTMRDKHPPALSEAGTRQPNEIVSDKDVDDMSEEELAALPESTQERLAPSRAR
jgi:hypothetical protein